MQKRKPIDKNHHDTLYLNNYHGGLKEMFLSFKWSTTQTGSMAIICKTCIFLYRWTTKDMLTWFLF